VIIASRLIEAVKNLPTHSIGGYEWECEECHYHTDTKGNGVCWNSWFEYTGDPPSSTNYGSVLIKCPYPVTDENREKHLMKDGFPSECASGNLVDVERVIALIERLNG
jgi:hypothetical protein